MKYTSLRKVVPTGTTTINNSLYYVFDVVNTFSERTEHEIERFLRKIEGPCRWVNFGRRLQLLVGHYCTPFCTTLKAPLQGYATSPQGVFFHDRIGLELMRLDGDIGVKIVKGWDYGGTKRDNPSQRKRG